MSESTHPVVFITGASSGIGLALAKLCASSGMRVMMVARRTELLRSETDALRQLGYDVAYRHCDVADRAELQAVIAQAIETYGRIDIAFLNAAVGGAIYFDDFSNDDYHRTIDVNVHGVVHAIEALVPIMKSQGGGSIVGISSLADARPTVGNGVYVASKAALTSLLESAALELMAHNIRVVTVRPGFVDTELIANNPVPKPQIMSAERAARIILRGVISGKRHVSFPLVMTALASISRLLPSSWWAWMWRRIIKPIQDQRASSKTKRNKNQS